MAIYIVVLCLLAECMQSTNFVVAPKNACQANTDQDQKQMLLKRQKQAEETQQRPTVVLS